MDSTLYTLSTFTEWADAERFAIRKANLLGCLVGIRWNEIFHYYTLSLVARHERHEWQYVRVIEPGTPHVYTPSFIGPWEKSERRAA